MKRIAVITSTRAEYGLLSPVLKKLRECESDNLCVELVVTGTHLSEKYGYTIREIENDKERIDCCITIPVQSQDEMDIAINQSETLKRFTALFMEKHYQAIVVLGDRYETLAIAIAASNTKTPIIHLCGGDTTEGAIDEWIRHSITKMSYLHFTTNEESKKRVLQLGEEPNRVFNYGSTSIDNILNIPKMDKKQALESIGLQNCKYALCTYHPVTMDNDGVEEKINGFLQAISSFPNIQFVITKSNADQGGADINQMLDDAQKIYQNVHVYTSLGVKRYLSLMQYAEFVLGNSSSGIIETPAFKIPTINIGERQRGRLHVDSILDCGEDADSIVKAIDKAMEDSFILKCKCVRNPYGDGHAAEKIAKEIINTINQEIDLKKKFYDVEINNE